ncbi:MAG TPA: PEPxxWA-CTERM sorting domain-containing protein [Sphingomicrobium sp.]|nr:PEPxxWA-CTERM sorting domain-containing protein [Sphingomicrobium sp.]
MRKMFLVAAASLCAVSVPALATTVPPAAPPLASAGDYSFNYTAGAGTYYGSGTLTVGSSGQITGITGTANGSTILGLSTYAGADNLLYDGTNGTNAWLDFMGLSFAITGNAFGIGNTNGGDYGITDMVSNPGGACCGAHPADLQISIAAVPEAATWAMMLVGFGGIGFAMRRQRNGTARLAQVA